MNGNDFRENIKNILSKYGTVEYLDGHIMLTDLNVKETEIPEILNDLIANRLKVRKFEPVGESLEEYFFKLIGERQ